MITIVCFKWRKSEKKLLPMDIKTDFHYGARHVNILYSSLKRNLRIPIKFICITDDQSGINPEIGIIPLWDKCRYLGGCYNRLYIFSADMRNILGDRFAYMDLDCVVTGDVTGVFSREEDFIINSYVPFRGMSGAMTQKYNGGLVIMNAGCRSQVWDTFDPEKTPKLLASLRNKYVGTDQAWIRYVLGDKEAVLTEKDGIYEARKFNARTPLPQDAKLVMFAGQRDPSVSNLPWIKHHWTEEEICCG